MPRWWGRLTSVFRRRRMVRVHMKGDGPSISGFYRGIWGGFVVLEAASHNVEVDKTVPLEGLIEIPKANIMFLQTLVAVQS